MGAIDGKPTRIKAPPNSGSKFYNYKGYFLLLLIAVCDAHYRFIFVTLFVIAMEEYLAIRGLDKNLPMEFL